jgi:hypothetical protein
MFSKLLFMMMLLHHVSASIKCSWGYRFDKEDDHFNIVYPDRNAVYFGFVIPHKTRNFTVASHMATASHLATASQMATANHVFEGSLISTHPDASYFSIQIYNSNNLVTPSYHWIDIDIMGNTSQVMDLKASYSKTMVLDPANNYFALFRIYNSFLGSDTKKNDTLYYWAGLPPVSYINDVEFPLCNIDYNQQGNIYSNISNKIDPRTGTVCSINEQFTFIVIPEGSLANSDANYMIACINSNTHYKINIKMPRIMCSVGYTANEPRPWINETYDLRYASMNIESTMAPRPTIESFVIPCDVDEYEQDIFVSDDVPLPGLLYRQMLPTPDFKYSIAHAKQKCYKHVDKMYDIKCIKVQMGDYYPNLKVISDS